MKRKFYLFLLIYLLFQTGCWGFREVDEEAFITILGLDKGKENLLVLTAQIAVPRGMGGGGMGQGGGTASGGQAKPTMTVTVECRSILAGLNMLNATLERRPSLTHLKVVVVSEELARQGIKSHLIQLLRYFEFRRSTFLVVSRGPAQRLIKQFQPIMENSPAKFAELFTGSQRYAGFIPFGQVHHFYNDLKSTTVQPVAMLVSLKEKSPENLPAEEEHFSEGQFYAGQLPLKGGNNIELMGTAVFYQDRMVGMLNGEETLILNLLRGWLKQTLLTIPDPANPKYSISLRIKMERKPNLKVTLSQGRPKIYVRLFLDGEIVSTQSRINYGSPAKLSLLEGELNKLLAEKTRNLIAKTQDEMQTDLFGFGNKARHLVATWPQWQKLNWLEIYPQAQTNVTVKIHLRRFGLLRNINPTGTP
ncbi:MAG: Ger(x)C family spore germination protein [Peptococcaceae bacterium]